MPARSARPLAAGTVSALASGEVATELADRLHSAAIQLLRRLRRVDTKIGLSGPRLSALSVVVFAGPLTLGDLAAAEQVKPPTMTRLVHALEARRLVTREPDQRDGRVVWLRATAKGRMLLGAGRARRVRALAEVVRRLEPGETATLEHALEVLEHINRELTRLLHD
jgi:DNA-binding MarR family transcriptional regulator